VTPPAPMRPLAETCLEIPGVALEPGWPLPRAHMGVHASCDLSQSLEACCVCRGWLLSLLPGEEHDVTRPRQALIGDGLNQLPVIASDRCRRDRGAPCRARDPSVSAGGAPRPRVTPLGVRAPPLLAPGGGVPRAVGRVPGGVHHFPCAPGRRGGATDGPLR